MDVTVSMLEEDLPWKVFLCSEEHSLPCVFFSKIMIKNQCEIFNRICMCVFGGKLWQTV